MGVSFLPSTELGLLTWSANFAAKLAEDPEFWGVSVEQSDAFVSLQSSFADAIRVANNPATRTRGTVAVKTGLDADLRVAARQVAKVIDGQTDVTDPDRLSLGLTVRAARTKSAPPATPPLIALSLRNGRTVTITLSDTGPSSGRRLPTGVFGAIIMQHVGDDSPAGRGDWRFVALTGRLKMDLFFDENTPPASQVWFTAAWFNHRKELSPQADPRSIHLAGGPAIEMGRTAFVRRAA